MIRAVLAVLLAVALLGVSFPVLEDARKERSSTLAESQLDAIEAAAVELVDSEEAVELDDSGSITAGDETSVPPDHYVASRRSLSVDVPNRGLTEAPVEYVAIGGVPPEVRPADDDAGDGVDAGGGVDVEDGVDVGGGDDVDDGGGVLGYRVADGDVRIRHAPVVFRVVEPNGTIASSGTPLVLYGDAELTLWLVELDGDRVVLVRRSD